MENPHETCHCCQSQAENPRRRKLLGWAVGVINVVLLGSFLGPVVGFVGSPLGRRAKGRWVPLLNEAELPVGSTREASFVMSVQDGYMKADRKYTVFVRRTETGLVCFDPACTHLGCRIELQAAKGRFLCPCHGGVFDADGKVVSGPPPKPLDQHPVKLEAGKVWIYKEV